MDGCGGSRQTCGLGSCNNSLRHGIVGSHVPCNARAKGHHAGTGKRGDVDNSLRGTPQQQSV